MLRCMAPAAAGGAAASAAVPLMCAGRCGCPESRLTPLLPACSPVPTLPRCAMRCTPAPSSQVGAPDQPKRARQAEESAKSGRCDPDLSCRPCPALRSIGGPLSSWTDNRGVNTPHRLQVRQERCRQPFLSPCAHNQARGRSITGVGHCQKVLRHRRRPQAPSGEDRPCAACCRRPAAAAPPPTPDQAALRPRLPVLSLWFLYTTLGRQTEAPLCATVPRQACAGRAG